MSDDSLRTYFHRFDEALKYTKALDEKWQLGCSPDAILENARIATTATSIDDQRRTAPAGKQSSSGLPADPLLWDILGGPNKGKTWAWCIDNVPDYVREQLAGGKVKNDKLRTALEAAVPVAAAVASEEDLPF